MRAVFGSEEWVEVPGLKAQDRRKVSREAKVVEGLMHSPLKDGILVSEILGLMYLRTGWALWGRR